MPRELEAAQHHLPEEVAGVEGVAGGIEADIDADRTVGEPLGQSVAIGGVVDEAAGIEVSEQVHEGQWWQKGQRARETFGSPGTNHRQSCSTATEMPTRAERPGVTGGGVPSSPIHGFARDVRVRSAPSNARSMPNA